MFTRPLTPGAELRLLQSCYAQEMFATVESNRQRLRQWLPWVDAIQSVEDEQAFIRKSLRQLAENGAFDCGIFVDGAFVGSIGLHPIDHANRKVELGYWLDAAHEGRGLMTLACRAMLGHVFKQLQLNRAIIYCAAENRRSRAVAERLGFRLEGTARRAEWLYDHFVDLAWYGLLASEWKA